MAEGLRAGAYHGDEVRIIQQAGDVQAAHASRLKEKHRLVVSGARLATLGKGLARPAGSRRLYTIQGGSYQEPPTSCLSL